MRIKAGATVVVSGLLIAGCSGGENLAVSSPSSPETAATLTKAVGQSGGYGCTANDPDSKCVAVFTVTAITDVPAAQCSQYGVVPAGSRLVQVALDARGVNPMPAPNQHLAPGTNLISQYWYGLGSDGYTTKAQVVTGCSTVFSPGPFYDPVELGQKARGEMVFAVPANSVKLQLRPGFGTTWEWNLPTR